MSMDERINKGLEYEKEFMEYFNDDERKLFTKYMDLIFRVKQIEEQYNTTKELLDEVGISMNGTVSTSLILLDAWRKDIQKELDDMSAAVIGMVYKKSLIDWYSVMKNKMTNNTIDPEFTKKIAKAFLDDKFGAEDSPSKSAMIDICTEAIEYFKASVRSESTKRAVNDINI